MKMTTTFVLLFGLLCFVVSFGNAFELEGYAGYYRFDSSVADKAEVDADNIPIFGLRFGSGARQIFSGETTISYGPMDDIRVILLMGNFLINIPVETVIPYVTLGTGTTIFLANVANEKNLLLDTETKFTLNYGGGFRYALNEFMALRFDFRDYVTFDLDFDTESVAESGEPTDIIDVGTIHNTVIAGGLSLTF